MVLGQISKAGNGSDEHVGVPPQLAEPLENPFVNLVLGHPSCPPVLNLIREVLEQLNQRQHLGEFLRAADDQFIFRVRHEPRLPSTRAP